MAPRGNSRHPGGVGADARTSGRLPGTLRRAGAALAVALGVHRVPAPVTPDPMPRLLADLGRLDAEMAALLCADRRTPGLKQRLDAASWAYDVVLSQACRTVGVPADGCIPFDPYQRLLAEAGLVASGVRW